MHAVDLTKKNSLEVPLNMDRHELGFENHD